MSIVLSIVEEHNNNVFGGTYSPTVAGEGAASYKLWPVFVFINGYLEVYRPFQEDFLVGEGLKGGEYVGGSSLGEIFMGEEKFHEGAQDFLALFKKIKNEYEKVFFR